MEGLNCFDAVVFVIVRCFVVGVFFWGEAQHDTSYG